MHLKGGNQQPCVPTEQAKLNGNMPSWCSSLFTTSSLLSAILAAESNGGYISGRCCWYWVRFCNRAMANAMAHPHTRTHTIPLLESPLCTCQLFSMQAMVHSNWIKGWHRSFTRTHTRTYTHKHIHIHMYTHADLHMYLHIHTYLWPHGSWLPIMCQVWGRHSTHLQVRNVGGYPITLPPPHPPPPPPPQ